ncbi:endoplasmic reticulum protein 29 [Mytilus galloprovincialis]|uniref:Endoplasmic reticulum resident protein 29 n=1 Tax=Mytilus galloprovincialis TaxID=29158 RepID=A0A8B6FHR2_MYTGA|nr:endoplasmic reticulum protein 29 [Mytilus galloprovincialis]
MEPNAEVYLGFLLLFALNAIGNTETVKGSIQLNSGVFEKIVKHHKAVLVKFDETYPYGDKQDTFKEVVEATMSQDDALCAEIQVSDYGEKENLDLAERYGVIKEQFPVYRLFLNGDLEGVLYKGDTKNANDIKSFLISEAGLWLGLPDCLQEFDELVTKFYNAADNDKKTAVVTEVEKAAEKLKEESQKKSAEIYIKTMKKVLEKGESFIAEEVKRVEKIRDGKISDKKREQLGSRLNILTSFKLLLKKAKKGKDEL